MYLKFPSVLLKELGEAESKQNNTQGRCCRVFRFYVLDLSEKLTGHFRIFCNKIKKQVTVQPFYCDFYFTMILLPPPKRELALWLGGELVVQSIKND